jgi:hypothetical protein
MRGGKQFHYLDVKMFPIYVAECIVNIGEKCGIFYVIELVEIMGVANGGLEGAQPPLESFETSVRTY